MSWLVGMHILAGGQSKSPITSCHWPGGAIFRASGQNPSVFASSAGRPPADTTPTPRSNAQCMFDLERGRDLLGPQRKSPPLECWKRARQPGFGDPVGQRSPCHVPSLEALSLGSGDFFPQQRHISTGSHVLVCVCARARRNPSPHQPNAMLGALPLRARARAGAHRFDAATSALRVVCQVWPSGG